MEEEFKCHHFHIRLFEKMIDRKIVGFLFCMCQLYYFSFEFHGNLVINQSRNNFLHINKMQIHITMVFSILKNIISSNNFNALEGGA